MLYKDKDGKIIVSTFEQFVYLKEAHHEPAYYFIGLDFNNREGTFAEDGIDELGVDGVNHPGVIVEDIYILAFDADGDEVDYEPNWKGMLEEQLYGIPMAAAIKTLKMNFKPVEDEDLVSYMEEQFDEHQYMAARDWNYGQAFYNPNSKSEYWLDDEPPPPMPISLN